MPIARNIRLPPPKDEDEFEDLVTEALKARHSNPHLVRVGRSGQSQHGIDGWDSVNPNGLVWQATTQQNRLGEKLNRDLALFDEAQIGSRSVFVFATSAPRDAGLQLEILRLTEERMSQGKCVVEPLFWDDIRMYLSDEVLRRHYPEWTPPSDVHEDAAVTGLFGLGHDVVAEGALVQASSKEWTIRLAEYLDGGVEDVISLLERCETVPSPGWVTFEGLGVARVIAPGGELRGRELRLPLEAPAPRTSVYAPHSDIEIGEDGDLFPDFRMVSGFPAALQSMRLAMSTQLGEWVVDPTIGTRCSIFYERGIEPPTLGRLFGLELAQLAFVPRGKERSLLSFIDRVVGIDVQSRDVDRGWLHTTATLLLHGHGEWRGPLKVFVGSGDDTP